MLTSSLQLWVQQLSRCFQQPSALRWSTEQPELARPSLRCWLQSKRRSHNRCSSLRHRSSSNRSRSSSLRSRSSWLRNHKLAGNKFGNRRGYHSCHGCRRTNHRSNHRCCHGCHRSCRGFRQSCHRSYRCCRGFRQSCRRCYLGFRQRKREHCKERPKRPRSRQSERNSFP